MPYRADYRRPRGWERIRKRVLRRDPVCTIAGPDCMGASTEVDHVVPEASGGSHDETNLAGVCRTCHAAKTAAETAAARWPTDRPRRERPAEPHPGSA